MSFILSHVSIFGLSSSLLVSKQPGYEVATVTTLAPNDENVGQHEAKENARGDVSTVYNHSQHKQTKPI